jgi:1-acyl-sn-glycerol-3-phosphate acyltransferase
MVQITQRAALPLEFLPPRFQPGLLRLTHGLLPVVFRLRLWPWLPAGIHDFVLQDGEKLARLYQQFQQGENRLILAFRHGEVDDPLALGYLLSRGLPEVADRQGIPLQKPLHVHGVYDRGMTLWAGDWLGRFLAGLGAIPIRRGKRRDLQGMRTVRRYGRSGQFPLAIAPEGATNGHSQRVSPLEPGVAQVGFWCAEDCAKAGQPQPVWIVPLGIQYRYPHPPWPRIHRLVRDLERSCGLPVGSPLALSPGHHPPIPPLSGDPWVQNLWPRLLAVADRLLSHGEAFYGRYFPQGWAPCEPDPQAPLQEQLMQRLAHLQDRALTLAEQYFGLGSEGTVIDRCRRMEEASWQDIYREDLPPLGHLSPVERGMADWLAQSAALHSHPMRLVESLVAVTGDYIPSQPTPERFGEMALLLFDVSERIRGRKMPARPRLGWRQGVLTVGDPMNVSDRLGDYQRNRAAAKAAIAQLTADLQSALESLIQP